MVKKQLGMRAKGRKITESAGECQLREVHFPYSVISEGENSPLSSQNMHFWDVYPVILDG
jgi:hypothetical protein